MSPTPILIDCDPGHDDAIALLLALASPEVAAARRHDGRGQPDARQDDCERDSRTRVRRNAATSRLRPAPTGRSSARSTSAADVHGETGLDGPDLPPPGKAPVAQHAADFLAEKIRGSGGPVTLIAVGPLTNVALLLALHPDARPERIVLMGGAIAEGNVTPAAEFNIWCDPEAAARVFASGIEITMVGLDVTHKALFTQAHIGRLAGRVGGMVTELLRFYNSFHRNVYGFDGSPIHDALAVAHVLGHDLVGLPSERRDRDRVGALPWTNGGGSLATDGAHAERARRSGGRRGRFSRVAGRANQLARMSLVFAAIAPHGTLPEAPVPGAETDT